MKIPLLGKILHSRGFISLLRTQKAQKPNQEIFQAAPAFPRLANRFHPGPTRSLRILFRQKERVEVHRLSKTPNRQIASQVQKAEQQRRTAEKRAQAGRQVCHVSSQKRRGSALFAEVGKKRAAAQRVDEKRQRLLLFAGNHERRIQKLTKLNPEVCWQIQNKNKVGLAVVWRKLAETQKRDNCCS